MKDIFWKIVNKIDFYFRYMYILCNIETADIILMATSAQTNLGDHAISIAERNFFCKYFRGCRIVEIPKDIYLKKRKNIVKKTNTKAIIAISGGGFLGDLWMTEENLVRSILDDYKSSKIVIFPQTIYFTDNSKEYEATFSYYKNVKKLIINARDKNSYDILAKELSLNMLRYIPDIVLSLNYSSRFKRKNVALLCLRTDKENCLSVSDSNELINILKSQIPVVKTTTIANHIVPISFRQKYVKNKLDEIASAKIVVTNRLHMMIFSAITGTPCIAIDNLSHKLSGVYEWIKGLPYIYLLNDILEFEDVLDKLLKLENNTYDTSFLMKYYDELSEEFKGGN